MKKAIACLLALPLALAACGTQTADVAQSTPTAETEQPTEAAETTETAPTQDDTHIAGRLREASMMMSTGSCVYSINEKWDKETNIETIYLIKTDCATATQQKVAAIELEAGMYYGMAAWDDTVELFLIEQANQDNPPEWRYTIDTATGSIGERQAVDDYFCPSWCDDAAMYEMDYANGYRIARMDRDTGEVSYTDLPEQTQNLYGLGDKWLIDRIVSPSPLPSIEDGDMYTAVLQNSEREYDLFDPATGEMQKIYSYPAVGDEYYYDGQRDGVLYFHHTKLADTNDEASRYLDDVTKLENGEMVSVVTLEKEYGSLQTLEDEQGELQWINHSDGSSMEIHDLNDGQTYYPAYKRETSDNANTGFPQVLLPNGQVMVLYGSVDGSSLEDKCAYAIIDRAAYLAGSTDYTPVEMYKGD